MSNLSPRALALYQAHGPGPVDWERMVRVVDGIMPTVKGHLVILSSFSDRYIIYREYEPDRIGPFFETRAKAEGWLASSTAPPADREKTEGEAGV